MPLCVPAHTRRQFGIFEGTHSVGRCWEPRQFLLSSFDFPCVLEHTGSVCVFQNTQEARCLCVLEHTGSTLLVCSRTHRKHASCVFWNTQEARGWRRAENVCMIESPAGLIRTHTKYIREAPPVLKTPPAGMKRFFIAAATLYAPTLVFFYFFTFFFHPSPQKVLSGGVFGVAEFIFHSPRATGEIDFWPFGGLTPPRGRYLYITPY